MLSSFLVRRYRPGEAAPSLSLRYRAQTHRQALAAHFREYHLTSVAEGERFEVLARGADRAVFDEHIARSVLRAVRNGEVQS